MEQEMYLNKIHREILEIMNYIDELCDVHHLRYYLTGGTLLGAIRHGGFIPWDDDLDIEMPREDYEKLLLLVQEENKYDAISYKTCEKYCNFFAKVSKKGTRFAENNDGEWGIFVDIFPIDNERKYGKHLILKKKIVRFFLNNGARLTKKDKSKAFKYYISKIFPRSIWIYFMEKIAVNLKEDYAYYINYGSQYSAIRKTMPKEWYAAGVRVPFEDRSYTAPKEYSQVLRRIFGEKYMAVPPVEKRRTHYPKYVKFSDGEEIYFDEPSKKVTIEDTLI